MHFDECVMCVLTLSFGLTALLASSRHHQIKHSVTILNNLSSGSTTIIYFGLFQTRGMNPQSASTCPLGNVKETFTGKSGSRKSLRLKASSRAHRRRRPTRSPKAAHLSPTTRTN
ncbi:unnamed protein product [Ectocarpus sp. 12 AP-2014]